MSAAAWNISGLVLVLVGVLLLFRYGMPFRVRTGGAQYIILEELDEADQKAEKRYGVLGWVGIVTVVAGTLCQIAANVPSLVK